MLGIFSCDLLVPLPKLVFARGSQVDLISRPLSLSPFRPLTSFCLRLSPLALMYRVLACPVLSCPVLLFLALTSRPSALVCQVSDGGEHQTFPRDVDGGKLLINTCQCNDGGSWRLLAVGLHHFIPYRSHTIPYHSVPYHTMSCHAMPYRIHLNTIPYRTHLNTIPHRTIPYHTISHHIIPYHYIPYRTTPYHTITYHTIPYHIIQMASYHIKKTSHNILSHHTTIYHIA